MKKEVTIIIPTYNDTYEKMDLSLKSIAEQHYNLKKVEVIIIDDASTNYKFTINEFKKKYPILEIKYFRQYQNTGPGLARQIGLDNATGEYIFFLDCGDYLYDLDVLHKFEKIQKKNYDIYAFLVYLDGMALSYYDGNSFIFGLFIKRNFILKHHIRFSKILRWEEDSYFYGLLESYNPKVKEEDSFAYFYSEDDDSITRKNDNAYVREYIGLSALIIKSTLLNKFFINNENKRWEIFVLAIVISYATMYDDIYVKKKNTKRISKILYLLKLMINIFNIDIESPYFKNTIDKYLLIYYTRTRINFSNFYIGNFLNKIQKQENLYGNYQIEGTNTTLEQLLNIYANLN